MTHDDTWLAVHGRLLGICLNSGHCKSPDRTTTIATIIHGSCGVCYTGVLLYMVLPQTWCYHKPHSTVFPTCDGHVT